MNNYKAPPFYKEPKLSVNALTTLSKRYLIKDEQGQVIEEPKDLFFRVARYIASADELYGRPKEEIEKTTEKFYDIMAALEFLPNSPTLMNAGRDLGQLSACFVLPVPDDTEGIFDAIKYTAMIHKSGGGTGFSFSNLRPTRDQVKSSMGVASGPISFMRIFDRATEEMKQGGTRRGANMGILHVSHPDIEEFIQCKYKPNENTQNILNTLKEIYPLFEYFNEDIERIIVEKTQFNNFNISVAVTDEYMRAVKNDDYFSLINPRIKKEVKKIKARELFDKIVSLAWENGEPGIIFIDTINKHNPTPQIGKIESTNPCGEQPLLPYESCNLGSINLAKFVKNGKVDYKRLEDVVETAVHFLDNVIDVNKYPLPQIEKMTKANRKIGLGVMGFADMLVQLRIPYNSETAIETAEEVMSFIQKAGRKASAKIAEEKGTFPNFKGSIYDKESKHFKEDIKLRNATITTIAPTGTLSIIADCSSGIEPLIGIAFEKRVLDGNHLEYVNTYLEDLLKERGLFSEELKAMIAKKGSLKDVDLPEFIKRIFVTSSEITPEWHVRMQAAFQKYTDNAVSKTINFPNSATKEDVSKAYMLAYELGCKGITVYRDGSRREQVYYVKSENGPSLENGLDDFKRPMAMIGITVKKPFGLSSEDVANIYVTGTYESDNSLLKVMKYLTEQKNVREIFINSSRFDEDTIGAIESFAISTSRALRSIKKSNEFLRKIAEDITDLPGGKPVFDMDENRVIKGLYDAISRAFKYIVGETTKKKEIKKEDSLVKERNEVNKRPGRDLCPKCGRYAVVHEEGCDKCLLCGYSKKGCS